MPEERKPHIKKHYFIMPVLVMVLFVPSLVQWVAETEFSSTGDYVNVLFIFLMMIGLPIVFIVAISKGKLKQPHDHFIEYGYLENTTLSRSKPGLLPTAGGLFMMLIIGSVVVGILVEFFQSWDSLTADDAWMLLLFFPFYLYLYVFLYLIARFFVNRSIARLMAGESFKTPGPGGSEPLAEVDIPGRCQVITEQEKTRHRCRLTKTRNAMGSPPLRILYLWNFDVGYPAYEIKSWQRYGPVYWLWSPANVPASQYMNLAFRKRPSDYFASSEECIDQWLNPPGEAPRRSLLGRRRYPAFKIACMANIWQEAVARACQHVDRVILDARSYTEVRSGLRWELEYVVRNVDVNRFLVLTDATTDLQAIVNTIHHAGSETANPLARIIYPPLLRPKEELVKILKKGDPPSLNYRAPALVELFSND